MCKNVLDLDQNSELTSINRAWDLSREHWLDLRTFESILCLYSLIVCLCLKYLVHPESWASCLDDCVFCFSRGNFIFFFNFLFDIFWNTINLASVPQLILISWSSICITLIILSVLMKLPSTSFPIMYNNMESRNPWRTCTMVKGSVKKPFI